MERTVIKPPELHVLLGDHNLRDGTPVHHKRRLIFNAYLAEEAFDEIMWPLRPSLGIEQYEASGIWTYGLISDVDLDSIGTGYDQAIIEGITARVKLDKIRPLLLRDTHTEPRWFSVMR